MCIRHVHRLFGSQRAIQCSRYVACAFLCRRTRPPTLGRTSSLRLRTGRCKPTTPPPNAKKDMGALDSNAAATASCYRVLWCTGAQAAEGKRSTRPQRLPRGGEHT